MNKSKEILLILLVILGFVGWSYIYLTTEFHPISFRENTRDVMYDLSSNWEIEHSSLVNNVTNYCGVFVGEDLIECVVNNLGDRYNYTDRNATDYESVLKKVDDIKEGYLCRDIALAYYAVFKRLGYFSELIFVPEHVYNHVYGEYIDCFINMDYWYCW